MADGYARATVKVGVVLVTSGPGATNAITGIATAYMDSIPLVVLSGQVPSNLIGNDAFLCSILYWPVIRLSNNALVNSLKYLIDLLQLVTVYQDNCVLIS